MGQSGSPGLLEAPQESRLGQWLGKYQLLEDLSWGLLDTKVLHLRAAGSDFILKSAGPSNHHLTREFIAHAGYTGSLVERGIAAPLRFCDEPLRLLVLDYLPGRLIDHTPWAYEPDIHFQAGVALRLIHDQAQEIDGTYEAKLVAKSCRFLASEHRIDEAVLRRAMKILRSYRPRPAMLVPTHGDWQPRNWLVENGLLRVIDFGRFEFRPAASDFARLASQQWLNHAELEANFLRGYGKDPRDSHSWPLMLLREAIGTAVWAYQVGDRDFEAQGHQMLNDALEHF